MKKTKIQYCSDLHLEFAENTAEMKARPLIPSGEILVLAGDIVLLAYMEKYNWFFDWASDHYETVYWIPGNHEYYGYSVGEKDLSFRERIRPNVVLLNNSSVEHENFVIHFSTLWSSIGPPYEKKIRLGVSDFRQISYGGEFITVNDFNYMHTASLGFLNGAFEKHKGKESIVVTHHVPTFMNYPEEYIGSEINGAFVTELSDMIGKWQPGHWIYGHHHRNVPDFLIGRTKMLTNQLGYVSIGDAPGFVRDKVITV